MEVGDGGTAVSGRGRVMVGRRCQDVGWRDIGSKVAISVPSINQVYGSSISSRANLQAARNVSPRLKTTTTEHVRRKQETGVEMRLDSV